VALLRKVKAKVGLNFWPHDRPETHGDSALRRRELRELIDEHGGYERKYYP
jgi:hypothetical protein